MVLNRLNSGNTQEMVSAGMTFRVQQPFILFKKHSGMCVCVCVCSMTLYVHILYMYMYMYVLCVCTCVYFVNMFVARACCSDCMVNQFSCFLSR